MFSFIPISVFLGIFLTVTACTLCVHLICVSQAEERPATCPSIPPRFNQALSKA